ncbi:hypothetical protein THAOC_14704 [Thalassiosira oceanica]|uniref:Uncharacterized protein n=1 Tax=Thalassiosira oceanica TaxID=159749 RepID=K0SHT8_THAOC|nr:hypothetical protein THAOC_14704 [Thalassiosira oceanica]|eukprot:EJK64549.1 hypothetical protein THAOC_14704 [Thalassiosira oceanica]
MYLAPNSTGKCSAELRLCGSVFDVVVSRSFYDIGSGSEARPKYVVCWVAGVAGSYGPCFDSDVAVGVGVLTAQRSHGRSHTALKIFAPSQHASWSWSPQSGLVTVSGQSTRGTGRGRGRGCAFYLNDSAGVVQLWRGEATADNQS